MKRGTAWAYGRRQSVLGWMRSPHCPACHGTGVIPVDGTGGRLTNLCTSCAGTGKAQLRRCVAMRDMLAAEELAAELERLTALVIADMARRLAPRLDLGQGQSGPAARAVP